jgi:hypothetical protein
VTEPIVAVGAQESSNYSGLMAVIHEETLDLLATDGATTTLLPKDLLVLI